MTDMDKMMIEKALEFRPDDKGQFDEIVARFADGMVHVETLSDQGCYVGFYWDDGRYCQWWIGVKGRSKLVYNHEDGIDDQQKHPKGYGNPDDRLREVLEGFLAWSDRVQDWENGANYLNGEKPPHGNGDNAWDDLDKLRDQARSALSPLPQGDG